MVLGEFLFFPDFASLYLGYEERSETHQKNKLNDQLPSLLQRRLLFFTHSRVQKLSAKLGLNLRYGTPSGIAHRISASIARLEKPLPRIPLRFSQATIQIYSKEGQLRMLIAYMKAALRHAKYEILEEDKSFYGEIPELKGVYAHSTSLESCREELEEVLEEWIFFRIYKNLSLPIIDGIKLEIKEVV
jgi:predicted RNase H-like HicB family nuclease